MKRLTLSQPGMTFLQEIKLGIHGIQVGFTHSERMVLYYLAGLALPWKRFSLFFSSVHAQ
jgi:hypothetical protein